MGLSCTSCWVRAVVRDCGGQCPFVPKRHRSEEFLYFLGDPAAAMWIVKGGIVALRRLGRARALCMAGDLVGAELVIDSPRTDTAEVMTESVLCGAERNTVEEWLGPMSPARAMLAATIRQASRTHTVYGGSSTARVAAWVLDQRDREGALRLRRSVIAGLLAMRSETLSRALSALASAGAIAVTRTDIRVMDVEALRHFDEREQPED